MYFCSLPSLCSQLGSIHHNIHTTGVVSVHQPDQIRADLSALFVDLFQPAMLQRQLPGANTLCGRHVARGLCLPAAAGHTRRRPHTCTAQRRRGIVAAARSVSLSGRPDDLSPLVDLAALGEMVNRFPVPVKLPVAQPGLLQQIQSSQAQAEAAQQALMSDGKLAEAAAGSEVLQSILETWATVQRAYHKALQPLFERHAEYAGSPAGGSRQRDASVLFAAATTAAAAPPASHVLIAACLPATASTKCAKARHPSPDTPPCPLQAWPTRCAVRHCSKHPLCGLETLSTMQSCMIWWKLRHASALLARLYGTCASLGYCKWMAHGTLCRTCCHTLPHPKAPSTLSSPP